MISITLWTELGNRGHWSSGGGQIQEYITRMYLNFKRWHHFKTMN